MENIEKEWKECVHLNLNGEGVTHQNALESFPYPLPTNEHFMALLTSSSRTIHLLRHNVEMYNGYSYSVKKKKKISK